MMTLAEVRSMYDGIVAEHGTEDSPYCRMFYAVLELLEHQAAELDRTNAALSRVLDVVTSGTFEASTLPEDWTDRT